MKKQALLSASFVGAKMTETQAKLDYQAIYHRLREAPKSPLMARYLTPEFATNMGLAGRFSVDDFDVINELGLFKYLNRNDMIMPIYDITFRVCGFRRIAWNADNPSKWNKFRAQAGLDTTHLALWNGKYINRILKNPVLICEGEADFLFLCEFLHKNGSEAVVIGIIGGHGLHPEWASQIPLDHSVFLLTDRDDAGNRYAEGIRYLLRASNRVYRFRGFNASGVGCPDGQPSWDLNKIQMESRGEFGRQPVRILDAISSPMEAPPDLGPPPTILTPPKPRKKAVYSDFEKAQQRAEERLRSVVSLLAQDFWCGDRYKFLAAVTPVVAAAKDGRLPHAGTEQALLQAAEMSSTDKETRADRKRAIKKLFKNPKIQ